AALPFEFGIHEVTKCTIGDLPNQRTRALGESRFAVDARKIYIFSRFGEEEFAERRRVFEALLESIETFFADQRIRIFAVRHEQKPRLASIAHTRQYRLDCAPCRLFPSAIAIKAKKYVGRIAKQDFRVVTRSCSAQSRHGLRDPVLMQGDH